MEYNSRPSRRLPSRASMKLCRPPNRLGGTAAAPWARPVAHGQWRTASGARPAARGQRRAASGSGVHLILIRRSRNGSISQVHPPRTPAPLSQTDLPISPPRRLKQVAPTRQPARTPLPQDVKILVQQQFRIGDKFATADREQDTIRSRSCGHAKVRACVSRVLDHLNGRHGLFEGSLKRHRHRRGQYESLPK